jgi:hypothetical protein
VNERRLSVLGTATGELVEGSATPTSPRARSRWRNEWNNRGRQTGRHIAYARIAAIAPIDEAGRLAKLALEAGADSLNGPTPLYPDQAPAVDALYGAAVTAPAAMTTTARPCSHVRDGCRWPSRSCSSSGH